MGSEMCIRDRASIVPPGHHCLFLFPFFLRFSFQFCRSPFPPSFSNYRFRFFVVSSSLFLSLRRSPWWRILFFCLGATSPLRCEPASLPIPLVCCLIYFIASLIFIYFSCLASLFFYFDLDVVCFILSCSCVYYLLAELHGDLFSRHAS